MRQKRYNVNMKAQDRDLPGWEIDVVNISEGGAKLRTDSLKMDRIIRLDFTTGQFPMTVSAKVVWKGQGCCGVEFQREAA